MEVSFRTKLSSTIALLFFVIQLSFFYLLYHFISTQFAAKTQKNIQEMQQSFQFKLKELEEKLEKNAAPLLQLLSAHPAPPPFASLSLNYLQKIKDSAQTKSFAQNIDRFIIISNAYNVLYDSHTQHPLVKTFPYTQLISNTKKLSTTLILNETLYYALFIPLLSSENKTVGWVCLLKQLLPFLGKEIQQLPLLPTTALITYQIFHQPWQWMNLYQPQPVEKNLLLLALKKNIKKGDVSFVTFSHKIAFVFPLPVLEKNINLYFLLLYSKKDALLPYHTLFYSLAVLGLVGMMILFISIYRLTYRFTTPLKQMSAAITRIKQGDYEHPIPLQGTKEADQLAQVFNKMMEAIGARESVLLHQSRHDAITSLPNRVYFLEYLNKYIEQCTPEKDTLAIVSITIDRFPQINHALGHTVGERLLYHAGTRLKNSLPNAKMIAHLSNHVFIAILPNLTPKNYEEEARHIIQLFETAFSVYTVSIDLDVFVGLSFYPKDGTQASILIQKADVALHAAIYSPERYFAYQAEKDPQHFNKLSLMSELRDGLAQNEFEMYYQPKISLESDKIVQVESLVRWQHPVKGFMPPQLFIPLAEETGHIKKLTMWLLDKGFSQCSEWHKQKIPLGVSINLSVKDLLNKALIPYIKELIEQYKVNPSWLTLEITESAFMLDPESAIAAICKLHEVGLQFSIDDFGTGFSSLSYLKKIPVHELKVDKSFTEDIVKNEKVAEIVHSTVHLAHNLNMVVVCEGVEDMETYEKLKHFGCDIGQGYLFSKPIATKALMEWLHISPWGIPYL